MSSAIELGYTEPDPAIDFSGQDVLRKAAILARLAGWSIPSSRIHAAPLVKGMKTGLSTPDFLEYIGSQDEYFSRLFDEASAEAMCLRYVAKVRSDAVTVGLEKVPIGHPLAGLMARTTWLLCIASDTRKGHWSLWGQERDLT